MLITDVRLATADLVSAAQFYREVLELPVRLSGETATVTVGQSTITLAEEPEATESNHLAFTIPSNRFASAKQWLAARVEPMSWDDGATELRLGEPWNSESVYFRGPDGLILELITRQHLANPADEPFTSAQLLCVSEVGLGTPSVPEMFAEIRGVFGMETFAGESPDFTTAGDQEGLLILVTEGRPWFPTADTCASTGSLAVSISGVSPGVVSSPAGWTVTGLR
jgi:catechol 2,3-dioxygenase-like lactoylglutathione lyase family enzyme